MSYFLEVGDNCIMVRKLDMDQINSCLKIHYDFKIEEIQSNPRLSKTQQQLKGQQFYAILGIKVIKDVPFFVIVSQRQPIHTMQGSQISQIKTIDWIPLVPEEKVDNFSSQLKQQLNNISKLFEQGLHYYSQNYELNKTFLMNKEDQFQEQLKTTKQLKIKITEQKRLQNKQKQEEYYSQFIWNQNLIKIDIDNEYMIQKYGPTKQGKLQYRKQSNIFKKWCVNVIQGYVNAFTTIVPNNRKLTYVLISRRSNKKAGTRFFSRGIDDHGNVANYTESQQIIYFDHYVITHVQLRGSVPVFFQQVGVEGINIQLNIQRNEQLTKKSFVKHFQKIQQNYQRVLCINLLSIKKSSQEKLTNFFESMISKTKEVAQYVKYQFFDFHEQCKNYKFQNTSNLINKIKPAIDAFDCNCYDQKQIKLISRQRGIIRTNCLDCLDRTNYVQSKVALVILQKIVTCINDQEGKEMIAEQKVFQQESIEQNSQIVNQFNALWADNGDSVSLHYTGIGSTHTDITKTGKRTLFGTVNHKMRSLMRFYTQFTDVNKHDAINKFLGNKTANFNNVHMSKLNLEVKDHNQQLLIMSWQFGDPDQSLQLFEKDMHTNRCFIYLKQKIKQKSKEDLIAQRFSIITIYLYVKNQTINWQSSLKSWNPFKKSSSQLLIKKWSQFLISELNGRGYPLISKNQQQHSNLLVFAHRKVIDTITHIKTDQILSKMKTNQSVLLTKLTYMHSSIVFQGFNMKNIDSFFGYLTDAHQKGFQDIKLGKFKSSPISQQSYRLILGNCGGKNKLDSQQVKKIQTQFYQKANSPKALQILNKCIHQNLNNDQIKQIFENQEQKSKLFRNYDQFPIEFIARNNRIFFWNQCQRIMRSNSYNKVVSLQSNQKCQGQQSAVCSQLCYEMIQKHYY